MIRHKIIHSKFEKTEIIPSMISEHNDIKVEVNNQRKTWKSTIMQKIGKES